MNKKEADKKILQYKEKIYGFALSKTSDYEQAQELAQEIICEVYISLLNSENIANYDGYVYRIASNAFSKFIAGLISNRKQSCIDDNPDALSVTDHYFYENNKKELETLKKEISYLSQRQRSVVYLFYYEKKTVTQIAKELNISANTVKWHLSDARQSLKETMIMYENVKIDENLAVNPIKFAFMGSSGTIVKKDTEDFFDTRLKQNIAWACYYEAKTVSEIAREVGVSVAYIADELKALVDNGFVDQVDSSKNPKYQAKMVISDIRKNAGEDGVYRNDSSELNKKIAKKLCQDYYKPIFEAFEKDPEHWGMSCPNNDVNFMKYSLVLLCQNFLQSGSVNAGMEKLKVKRPDGGNYIANATVANDWQELNGELFPDWIMGYMMNWGDDYYSLQANCRFTDRSMEWKDQVCFEALVKFIKNNCHPDALELKEYESICKNGYIHNNQVQVVTMKGGNKSPWDQLKEKIAQFDSVITDLKEFGKQIDEEFQKGVLQQTMPDYTKQFMLLLNTDRIGQIEVIPFILEEMLNSEMIKPLSEVQKKAALSILSL